MDAVVWLPSQPIMMAQTSALIAHADLGTISARSPGTDWHWIY
jgi:hypothetical protein